MELVEKIDEAFTTNNSNHRAQTGGYYHNTDSSNLIMWDLKRDGSIMLNGSTRYSYGIEIVSPVLKGNDGLVALNIVCDAIKDYTTANKSCGLHVHHGIARNERNNLFHLINNFNAKTAYFSIVIRD